MIAKDRTTYKLMLYTANKALSRKQIALPREIMFRSVHKHSIILIPQFLYFRKIVVIREN